MSGGGLSGEDKVLDLVGSIYDAALDAQLWPGVLNRIGDAVGGPHVVFGFYDPANGTVSMHAPRTDPDILRSFDDWSPEIPALPCTGNHRPGEVFTGGDVISRDEFTSTAFYNELWRPGGFSADPLVTNLFADGAACGHIASHGLLNQSRPHSSQKRLFAALAQHLVRAVALQRRVYHLTIANERALTGLDGLQQGFLLVDAEARPLFVNRAARALLDSRDGLRLEAGALSTSDADGGRTLRGLIKSCAGDVSAVTGSGGEVALAREARLPLDVVVTPVRQETATAIIPWTFSQRAVAIVLVSDPETEIQARVEDLRQRFGFTPAEAAFALEIVKGDGRQAAADRLGITVGTARSHLSSIFDKTGSRRQAELVRLLLQK
ncbi:helix-turn-helix transcriptional regulator [Bradyrhizobium sp. sGM-13]|uniref:helix-turn-helix transcriptional regulator n=1 Tax=Bradyrhizobium sp. sGM-13 TaxID=2831781 RepID=UPI001BCEE5AB|nr:helix-turn-helix transcriptional regulator [Bradyrhizobium sp. sGM-13]